MNKQSSRRGQDRLGGADNADAAAVNDDVISDLLDEAIDLSKGFNVDVRDRTFKLVVSAEDLGETALTYGHMPTRQIRHMRKIYVLLDEQLGWAPPAAVTPETIVDAFITDGYQGLPEGIRPPAEPPRDAIMQLLITQRDDGTLDA
eukprot:971062-Karenia_brevis.AAC.1